MHDTPHDDLFLRHAAQPQSPASQPTEGRTDFRTLSQTLSKLILDYDPEHKHEVDHLSAVVMHWRGDDHAEARCLLLVDACFYYQRIGCSFDGIPRGKAARDLALRHGLRNLERRACNVLGGVYLDSANFEDACVCLERALVIARELDDPFLECVAYSTTALLFKEMGCYVDALAMVDRSLGFAIDTDRGEHLRFVNATNGLFCAHRLRDEAAALRYMAIAAAANDNPLVDAVTQAAFEYNRALYLLSHQDAETADLLIKAACARHAATRNGRVRILLATAAALCDWSSHVPEREADARRKLRELYHRSRQTHLYHDDVLRALMQVHSRPTTREDAEIGVAYAKELVEYTTSVKHAKFYRQMSDQGVPARAIPAAGPQRDVDVDTLDVFANARRWLADDVGATPLLPAAGDQRAPSHDIRMHDELSAIHDDLAAIRTASLKGSIRTAAYDMAENWALAAEFLDDQTGQHCFRVGRLAGMIAAEIGKDADYCVRIEHAARLHDIGKISVNELILLKPGPLDPGELIAMRAHAEVGGFLLQYSEDPTLQMAATIARHHHEWWNGTGYPHGLAGDRIPLEARICALADVYDALTNARPYKRAWPHRTTIEQMMCESGVHFDPRLMTPFLRVLERHIGSNATPPSTQLHLKDMDANGLLVSRRKLLATINLQ
jgi:HD-GYP domain-containing protein (c-di-GMP phosphodiesterase class II)